MYLPADVVFVPGMSKVVVVCVGDRVCVVFPRFVIVIVGGGVGSIWHLVMGVLSVRCFGFVCFNLFSLCLFAVWQVDSGGACFVFVGVRFSCFGIGM